MKLKQKVKVILKKLGKDFDISVCSQCGKPIVVRLAEMELPLCKEIDCVYESVKNS